MQSSAAISDAPSTSASYADSVGTGTAIRSQLRTHAP